MAVAANSVGNGDQEEARQLFQLVADRASSPYRAKAIMSLGALARNKGDLETAVYFCREAMKASGISLTGLQAVRGIAVLKSVEGYHQESIRDLEGILPAMRTAPTHIYLDCLNSYAVELSILGRRSEAENVSKLVTSSSLAPRYPEWQATLLDIRAADPERIAVAVSSITPPVSESSAPNSPATSDPRIQITIELMKANLSQKLSLPSLGELVNLSVSHLSRLFKNQTQVSPGRYLTNLRMEQARHLLETSFLSIKQVMSFTGYATRKLFLAQFRSAYGMSPSAYRKQALNASSRTLPPND